jgi:ribosomal protein S27E
MDIGVRVDERCEVSGQPAGGAPAGRLFARAAAPFRRRVNGMLDKCPGSANLRTPTLTIKKCPQCGEETELFSNDVSVTCTKCGFVVYNDIASCIQWCKHARECLGPEMFEKLAGQKQQ